LIPLSENHVRRVLLEFKNFYNRGRPHASLGPGVPEPSDGLPAERTEPPSPTSRRRLHRFQTRARRSPSRLSSPTRPRRLKAKRELGSPTRSGSRTVALTCATFDAADVCDDARAYFCAAPTPLIAPRITTTFTRTLSSNAPI
jgi:hypothetical protein